MIVSNRKCCRWWFCTHSFLHRPCWCLSAASATGRVRPQRRRGGGGVWELTWFLRVAGRVAAVGVQGLGPLLPGRVAGLVGVPCLFAVVAKLCAAALSPTHQPGTAGAAWGDDGKPEGKTRRRQRQMSQKTNIFQRTRQWRANSQELRHHRDASANQTLPHHRSSIQH